MAVTFVGTPVLQTVADAQALLAMDRPAGAAPATGQCDQTGRG